MISKLGKWIKLYKNWYLRVLNHRLLGEGKTIRLVLRDGTKFNLTSGVGDDGIIEEMYLDRIYTPEGFEIKDGWVVLDIGAQKGFFSIFAASFAKNVKVYSFEPFPKNFKFLTENIKQNGIKNIKAFQLAVCKACGKRVLYLCPGGEDGHTMFISKDRDSVEVECTTLSKIIQDNNLEHIDLLKMDCEGSEYEILFNADLDTLKKIDRIAMEWHLIQNLGRKDIENFLKKIGYEVNARENYIYAKWP